MKKIESECCGCGLPCVGSSCPYSSVEVVTCDGCDEDLGRTYYTYDEEDFCEDCLIKVLINRFVIEEGTEKACEVCECKGSTFYYDGTDYCQECLLDKLIEDGIIEKKDEV